MENLPTFSQVGNSVKSICVFNSRLTVRNYFTVLHNGEELPLAECNAPDGLYSAYYTQCNSEIVNSCHRENNPFQNSLLISLTLHITVSTNSTGDYICQSYIYDREDTLEILAESPKNRLAIGKYTKHNNNDLLVQYSILFDT